MTLHQLKVFSTVAKFGSVTRAAENLHVRQPSVTLLMKGLQNELQVRLFERLGNKFQLTEIGRRVFCRVEEVLSKVDGIAEEIDEVKGLTKGKLSVGGSGLAGATFLSIAVQSFKSQYTRIEVSLNIERSGDLEQKLLGGTLDLAVLARPPESSHLIGDLYYEEEVVVIGPPNHPLTRKRAVSLEDISRQSLIVPGEGSRVRRMLEEKFAERGLIFKPRLEIDLHRLGGRDALKSAVASGLGISFQALCHVRCNIKSGRLKLIRVPELQLTRALYIVTHKNREQSPLVPRFLELLEQYKDRMGS